MSYKGLVQNTSKEQMLLNKRLYDACSKNQIDLLEIKELINQGAEPLGLFGADDVVYASILCHRTDDADDNPSLYQITKLFVENGMEIKTSNLFRWSDDPRELINPLNYIHYLSPSKAVLIIDLLINENTEIDLVEELIGDLYIDSTMIKSELDEVETYVRILMYLATLPYILNNSKYLRDCIDYDKNNYDLNIFKKLDNYYIRFDESNVERLNNQGLVIYFYDSKTNQQIWKIVQS